MTGRTNTNERSNTKTPKRREDNFTIAHLNARSVLPRTGTTSPSSRTSSLRISWTSLPLARLDIEIEIPGYTIFGLDRPNKVGGGVCAFVKNNLMAICH